MGQTNSSNTIDVPSDSTADMTLRNIDDITRLFGGDTDTTTLDLTLKDMTDLDRTLSMQSPLAGGTAEEEAEKKLQGYVDKAKDIFSISGDGPNIVDVIIDYIKDAYLTGKKVRTVQKDNAVRVLVVHAIRQLQSNARAIRQLQSNVRATTEKDLNGDDEGVGVQHYLKWLQSTQFDPNGMNVDSVEPTVPCDGDVPESVKPSTGFCDTTTIIPAIQHSDFDDIARDVPTINAGDRDGVDRPHYPYDSDTNEACDPSDTSDASDASG